MVKKKVTKEKKDKGIKKLINDDLKSVKKAIKKDADTIKKIVKKKQKMTSKKQKFVCSYCNNEISELDKQVLVTTSDKGKITEEAGFHFSCWVEYFNNAVTKKAKENVAKVQKKVMGLVDNPLIKSMLGSVKGTDNLFAMLQMPLTEDAIEKVKEKIQDGRKKTETTETQMC